MKLDFAKFLRGLAGLLAAVFIAAGLYFFIGFRKIPGVPATPRDAASAAWSWPTPAAIPAQDWQVFQGGNAQAVERGGGPAAGRFRLAGTFFLFGDAADASTNAPRKAILDDLRKNEQRLVGEGEAVDGYDVVRVYEDRVILRSGGVESELRLSFAGGDATAVESASTNAAGVAQEILQDETRFGGRVGFNRWVFKRDELMKYYGEIMDDPERLATLFVSMKPDYRDSQVAGYYLDPEGEEDFFRAAGLRKGDVIRKVNSMNMTSQKRAEYLMGEFVKNRLNAFVLDIEREGKPEKLIYLLR